MKCRPERLGAALQNPPLQANRGRQRSRLLLHCLLQHFRPTFRLFAPGL
jgi:hypothetical protein